VNLLKLKSEMHELYFQPLSERPSNSRAIFHTYKLDYANTLTIQVELMQLKWNVVASNGCLSYGCSSLNSLALINVLNNCFLITFHAKPTSVTQLLYECIQDGHVLVLKPLKNLEQKIKVEDKRGIRRSQNLSLMEQW